ncbi:hypothetical protein HRH44_09490, partial [Enterococcus faecalis]|uniref:hypothetical protein n=1 Tax=Enterococcus faecalis TaxID=1351 RepID=UPI001574652D
MDWNECPCKIDTLENVDCIFSIDENGNSTLKNAHLFNENNKLFTITGVYIETEYVLYHKNRFLVHQLEQHQTQPFHEKLRTHEVLRDHI